MSDGCTAAGYGGDVNWDMGREGAGGTGTDEEGGGAKGEGW